MENSQQFPKPLKDQYQSALERESSAWHQLHASSLTPGQTNRVDMLDSWFTATHDMRDTQALLTAAALQRAAQSLRESASVLTGMDLRPNTDDGTLPLAPSPQVLRAPPQLGRQYRGRGTALWTVESITHDELEPHLYLAQLREEGKGPDAVVDVYSEDWPLFCVVQGLRNL